MKRGTHARWIILAALIALLLALAGAGSAEPGHSFIMPASLRTVGDEAFSGTAAERIVLPGTTESVGSMAFADMPFLKEAVIREGTTWISDDAFRGVTGLTILGDAGSYAEEWAGRNGFRFFDIDWFTPSAPQPTRLLIAFAFLLLALALAAERRPAAVRDLWSCARQKRAQADLIAYYGFP